MPHLGSHVPGQTYGPDGNVSWDPTSSPVLTRIEFARDLVQRAFDELFPNPEAVAAHLDARNRLSDALEVLERECGDQANARQR